ncbi:MAG: GDP-mannose 4,6-dehydratase [Sphingomonas sp.]
MIHLGNLDVERDFGDVRSVASAYAALSLDPPQTPVINVCTGKVWSIRDILAAASRITGHRMEVEVDPKLMRRNEVAILAGDATLLRSILPGWQPHALEETLEWMLSA